MCIILPTSLYEMNQLVTYNTPVGKRSPGISLCSQCFRQLSTSISNFIILFRNDVNLVQERNDVDDKCCVLCVNNVPCGKFKKIRFKAGNTK